jgi:CheY-like chemotaxis protein
MITDLGMPDMTGWQVARQANTIRPEIPIILLTGWGAAVTGDQAADVRVSRILSKPVRIGDLLETIHGILHGREAENPPPAAARRPLGDAR